ncbi:MAG: helix-turn-helix transcriptional regulator [Burkholderiales bacterium]
MIAWMLPSMKKAPKALDARAVFARNLRMARRLRDLSQESLGLESGLSRAYVSSVEGGARNISIDNMGLLASALQVPLRDLVDPDKFTGLDFY